VRPPLLEMVVRTPELDRSRYPHLPHLNYPFGGTMGIGVRSAGSRNHAGWDLYAAPGTSTIAITDGRVVHTGVMTGYGNVLLLEFQFRGKTLYALYAHLQHSLVRPDKNGPAPLGRVIELRLRERVGMQLEGRRICILRSGRGGKLALFRTDE
jgi:hypothetical protein